MIDRKIWSSKINFILLIKWKQAEELFLMIFQSKSKIDNMKSLKFDEIIFQLIV